MACTLTISYLIFSTFPFTVNAGTNSDGKIFPKYISLIPHIDEKKVSDNKSQYKLHLNLKNLVKV